MLEILPAIIPRNVDDLREHLEKVRGLVPAVQVDVLDGKFVAGEKSFPFAEGGWASFEAMQAGMEDLPFKDEFYFEVDLMIAEPERHIEDFVLAGFSRVIVHIESTNDMERCIVAARKMDAEIGIAINIDTPNEEIDEWIDKVDVVQCMGIALIGAQGRPFDGRAVEKVEAIRRAHSDIMISVDGGVSLKTASFLLGAGAERLVAGSAIFGSEDAEKSIQQFYALTDVPEEGRYEI